jgi:hypothetical protein
MKKILSIPLMLLILFSGIDITVATHYCGGNLSGTKISLNGELASCGMENNPVIRSSQYKISNHCCENIVASLSICSNYIPTASCCIPDLGPDISHVLFVQDEPPIRNDISFYAISCNKRPPGIFNPADVELQVICLFQI